MYSETEGSGVHLQIIRRKATSSHYTLHVTHYYTCGQWVECCLSLQRDNDDEVHQDQNQEQIYYQEGFFFFFLAFSGFIDSTAEEWDRKQGKRGGVTRSKGIQARS